LNHWFKNPKLMALGPLALLLAAILACGSSATATPIPASPTAVPASTSPTAMAPTSVPSTSGGPAPTAVPAQPTAMPTAAPPPPAAVKPSGTLTVGQKELGPYQANPKLIGNPQIFLNSAIPITETLGMYNFDNGQVGPMLAKSWDVSADGQTWTFHIRDDVEFHRLKTWPSPSARSPTAPNTPDLPTPKRCSLQRMAARPRPMITLG